MNKEILKERMRKMKSNKGITLIALIITIVVLLILAVVAIGAVQDSNIIAHAQNAAKDYNSAKEEEDGLLKEYEIEIDKYIPNKKTETVGVKAYSVDGAIAIFTPDNKVNVFYTSSSVIPDQTFDVTETSKEEIKALGVSILGFDEEGEDENLIFLLGENFAGIATNDRNKLYMATEDETTGILTISESVYVEHEDLLLTQYYHDSADDYEYFASSGGNGIVYINYSNEALELYIYNNAYVKAPISDVSIEPNTTDLTINVDDSQVTLTSEAKKISFRINNGDKIVYYLQEGNLYWGGLLTGVESLISNSQYVFEMGTKYGVTTKYINIEALPTE